jgi:enoyl-CoA hydratase
MNAGDAIFAGFADSYVPGEVLPQLIGTLANGTAADEAIGQFSVDAPNGTLAALQDKITGAFAGPDAMSCVHSLDALASGGDEWASKTLSMLRRNSPLSVASTFAAIIKARELTALEDCLALEYRFAYRALTGHEFLEGIRALVIDKDRKPDWRPATLEDVTPQMVEDVLAPLGQNEWKAA